jgi:protein TonB
MPIDKLPRPFGSYLLTAELKDDALGRQFRALRVRDERTFVRLRTLDSPELLVDPLLDAIDENGEVHGFLKNPAVARGVDMDSIDGVPYVAWSEANGRTLADLHAKSRSLARRLPVEHALLIAEKVATALDHAYNTTIDGDRTLHGLVWPGFVTISDDGEIRLAGFGLAQGVLPAIGRPRLAGELAPYLAPEEREGGIVGRNSDVFSVGVLLLELLTGQAPPADPVAFLKGAGGGGPPPIQPEILGLLRMTLGPAEARYQSSGDLRRELGKLLFSGPYAPSTFNLAYFLNDLFREEIDAETRARKREATAAAAGSPATSAPSAAAPAAEPERSPATAPPGPPSPSPTATPTPSSRRESGTGPGITVAQPAQRGPLPAVWIGGAIAALAVAGGIFVISRRPPAGPGEVRPLRAATAAPTPTLLPEFQPTPAGPTTGMTETQFRDEVSRRVSLETQRLEAEVRAKHAPTPIRLAGGPATQPTAYQAISIALPPSPVPTATLPPAVAVAPALAVPTPQSEPEGLELAEASPPAPPTRAAAQVGALVPPEEVDTLPRIATVVKPAYPPLALKARIGGIVVLRVLVSERGLPAEIAIVRKAPAGLDKAAIAAVQKWTFTPATKDGVAVRTWMTIPIPFEP